MTPMIVVGKLLKQLSYDPQPRAIATLKIIKLPAQGSALQVADDDSDGPKL